MQNIFTLYEIFSDLASAWAPTGWACWWRWRQGRWGHPPCNGKVNVVQQGFNVLIYSIKVSTFVGLPCTLRFPHWLYINVNINISIVVILSSYGFWYWEKTKLIFSKKLDVQIPCLMSELLNIARLIRWALLTAGLARQIWIIYSIKTHFCPKCWKVLNKNWGPIHSLRAGNRKR